LTSQEQELAGMILVFSIFIVCPLLWQILTGWGKREWWRILLRGVAPLSLGIAGLGATMIPALGHPRSWPIGVIGILLLILGLVLMGVIWAHWD